jgi:hypothetical protein
MSDTYDFVAEEIRNDQDLKVILFRALANPFFILR